MWQRLPLTSWSAQPFKEVQIGSNYGATPSSPETDGCRRRRRLSLLRNCERLMRSKEGKVTADRGEKRNWRIIHYCAEERVITVKSDILSEEAVGLSFT